MGKCAEQWVGFQEKSLDMGPILSYFGKKSLEVGPMSQKNMTEKLGKSAILEVQCRANPRSGQQCHTDVNVSSACAKNYNRWELLLFLESSKIANQLNFCVFYCFLSWCFQYK